MNTDDSENDGFVDGIRKQFPNAFVFTGIKHVADITISSKVFSCLVFLFSLSKLVVQCDTGHVCEAG